MSSNGRVCSCRKGSMSGVFNFNCAACVARFLSGLPKPFARRWWMRFKKEKGEDFMKQVRVELEK